MKLIAMISNGVVQNTSTWDGTSEWDPGEMYQLIDITNSPYCLDGSPIQIGTLYDGVNFTNPVPDPLP